MNRLTAWCLFASCLLAVPALAGPPMPPPPGPPMHGGPGGPGGPDHAGMAARLKEVRGQLLRKEAGLDDAAAAKAEKVLDAFDAERQKAHKDMGEANRALHDLIGADSKDEAAYKKGLDAVVASARALQDLRGRELEELRKVLSQRDTAKVVLALERMQQAMHREMRQTRKAWLKAEMQRLEDEDAGGPDGKGPPPPPAPPPPPGRRGGR